MAHKLSAKALFLGGMLTRHLNSTFCFQYIFATGMSMVLINQVVNELFHLYKQVVFPPVNSSEINISLTN